MNGFVTINWENELPSLSKLIHDARERERKIGHYINHMLIMCLKIVITVHFVHSKTLWAEAGYNLQYMQISRRHLHRLQFFVFIIFGDVNNNFMDCCTSWLASASVASKTNSLTIRMSACRSAHLFAFDTHTHSISKSIQLNEIALLM